MVLCVFGAASDDIPEVYIKSSETLGESLAAHGHTLLFGGGGSGVMGAVSRGVRRRGGHIIGVAPRFFDQPGVLTDCDELVLTDTMHERKELMEERSDSFIAAPGGIGTLDEFFQVLTLRSLSQHKKPVALYNAGGYYDGLLGFLHRMEDERFVGSALWELFGVFTEPEALLAYIERGGA